MSDLGRQVKYGMGLGADAAAAYWFHHLSFDFAPRAEYVNNESAYGVLERTNSATAIRHWSEGELEAKLTANSAGYILAGAFGSVATADNPDSNAAVKDHTFTLSQNVAGQQVTFYEKDSLGTQKFTNGRIGEWTLEMELDEYIRYTAAVMAKDGVSTTATPALEASPVEFTAKHFSVKTATNVAGLAGATAQGTVESFSLTVNPNIEPDYEAGSTAPYAFTSRGYEIEFEMTCRYNSTDFRQGYRNGTSYAMQVSVVNTDVTIGAAANPGLVLTIPKFNITDWSPEGDLDDPRTQTLTGTVHYSAADAYAIRAVLTNTVASYA